jgi:hypothetical protein
VITIVIDGAPTLRNPTEIGMYTPDQHDRWSVHRHDASADYWEGGTASPAPR